MSYKEDFVKFLLTSGAMTFGDFTLKSGRKSPYMINAGRFNTGQTISRLGCFYARAIKEKMQLGVIPPDVAIIFGSAYKGIPLATAASIALHAAFDIHVGWCFNRKEVKDHGEGGVFVGKQPGRGDKILIIDDVMTAGTALRETASLIRTQAPEAEIVGSVIAVDRAERGGGTAGGGRLSAVAETQYEMGFPVFSIINIDEIVSALKDGLEFPAPAQPPADFPSGPYRQPNRSGDDGYLCGLCEEQEEPEKSVILPTPEQIAAIEAYLREHRAG